MSNNKPERILIWGMSENIGGIETFIMNVYRNLDRKKVQFDFLCAHNCAKLAFEDEIISMGGRVFRIMYSERESFIKARTCLKKFFDDHNEIKGIHVHANFPYAFPLKYAKKAGIKIRIIHSHNSSEINKETNKIKNFIYAIRRKQVKNQIKKYPTDYFACSDLAGKYMFNNINFRWIKNGIDLNNFAYKNSVREKYRFELGLGPNTTVIGFIGRYREQKNPLYMLDIFSEYAKMNEDSVLLMIGIGEMQKAIDNRINYLNIEDKVIQLGRREDTNNLYQAMDAFLLPSIYEGLPVVLVEAQTAGLECFVSNRITKQIAITDLIHYYSIDENPSFWAKKMKEEIKDKPRKEYEEQMRIKGFDMKTVAKELEKRYLEEK